MSAIEAVTLDAAGTLIRVREPVGRTYSRLAAAHGIPVQEAEVGRAFRTVFPRMAPLAFGAADRSTLQRQERHWWSTLVRSCLGAHGQHRAFAAFFDELYSFYAGPEAWDLYPEVETVLDALHRAAVPVAVVSNFDSRLHAILEHLGVRARFRAVLCSSEAGAAKPDARIFHAACRALGSRPERSLHAGDSRSADLEGARKAGMTGLWLVREGGAAQEPDAIADLRALPPRAGVGPG